MPAGITWLGHATVLVELDGLRVLTDPVVRSRVGPLVRIATPVKPETLEGLDVVLLSHLHADHADLKSLRKIGRDVTLIGPRGSEAWLRGRGFTDVREIESGEAIELGAVTLTAIHAVHEGQRHRLAPDSESVGYLLSASSSVYFAGDTGFFSGMGGLRGTGGVGLIPVAGWGPARGGGPPPPTRAGD